MDEVTYKRLQEKVEYLKGENQSLKNQLKRRDKKIKNIKMNGPDAGLIKANVKLMDELNDLKEKIQNESL